MTSIRQSTHFTCPSYAQFSLASLWGGMTSSRFVAPDASVSPKSVFSHSKWYMEAWVSLPGISESDKTWDFELLPGYPEGFALSLAEYAYARLFKPVATHERLGQWLTVRNELFALKCFAEYCYGQGRTDFNDIDNQLLDQYRKHIWLIEGKSDARVRYIFMCIYRLWEYGSRITAPITEMPFGKPFRKYFNVKNNGELENKTQPIPEAIYSAIMAAALNYVLEYSPIIINAWEQLRSLWSAEINPLDLTNSGKSKRFAARGGRIIEQVDAYWRRTPLKNIGNLYEEVIQLRTACTLTIIAYSGIRSSELLSLEAGCYVSDKDVDGQSMHYINTKLYKHKSGGVRDTWVVIDEVVEAIKVLEILTQRIRDAANDKRLMLTNRSNSFCSVKSDFVKKSFSEYTMDSVVYQINRFRDYCNLNLCREPIPGIQNDSGNHEPWKFNVRQFRRTLARYIARQPFGIIAGMLQYKHVEVAIFQGYAGNEPDWNKLLEQEKVLANVDILGELAMDLSNGMVAGEFGNRLMSEFVTEFKGRAEDFPPSQIAKWLASTYKALFIGKFNFCFFDPSMALCTSHVTQKDRPILNFCQPEHCGNACVGKRHKPMWEAQLKQAKELAEHPKASEFQRNMLKNEIEQLETVVHDLRNKFYA